ncbi:MAG: RNA 2',3'-cyclic phosphodiesterase [Actinomycetota bacterium]|nr:RNA 2',3'-cyclic phosphodiesterase [Actinomycetota bacterium]
MTKRLFVALKPPRAALDELSGAVQPLRDDAPAARWTRLDSWHLTLEFLGAVEEPGIVVLMQRLDLVAGQHGPIELSITGGGRFGDRVLWAGITGDLEPLRRLARAVRAAALEAGVQVDSRPYRGHLTLARGAPGINLRPLVERLRQFSGSAWAATELYLIESRLGAGPDGTALYETCAHWPLSSRLQQLRGPLRR